MINKINNSSEGCYIVCTFYKFFSIKNCEHIKGELLNEMVRLNVKGTLLLAQEGINGSIAGKKKDINQIIDFLFKKYNFQFFDIKHSYSKKLPFKRSRVKVKKEIITMGMINVDPTILSGTYVEPLYWNHLIDDPSIILIDVRNQYEIDVGTFENSINPRISTFREFPNFVDRNLDSSQHKKIALFCTGGIRCEKATAYLRQKGFKKVFQLKDGILKYCADVARSESKWHGECFVFDDRITVDHDLKEGSYDQCHACRMPITDQDKHDSRYKKGVSCAHCFNRYTDSVKKDLGKRTDRYN